MNIILPLEISPAIKSYVGHAYPFGIIEANFGEQILLQLLCDKYINCIYSQNDRNQFYICETDSWFEHSGAITRRNIVRKEKDITSVREVIGEARRRLIKGEYIYSSPNEGKISAISQGVKYDFDHECLIYGFNDEEKFYQSIGYVRSSGYFKHYTPYKITYDEYADALLNVQKDEIELLFYKVNKDFILPDFDLNNILTLLGQYIDSDMPEISTRSDLREIISVGELKFGISAWKQLSEYIDNIIPGEEIDMRYVRSYMEHKCLMEKRIIYILKYLAVSNTLMAEEASGVYKEAQKIMSLSLKYNLTGNKILLKHISDKIKFNNLNEIEYLSKAVDYLSNF